MAARCDVIADDGESNACLLGFTTFVALSSAGSITLRISSVWCGSAACKYCLDIYETASSPRVPRQMSLAKVLLVDDNDAVRTTMHRILELNNFEVVSASSVNQALSHIAAEKFGVLLCDLHMPDPGDGLT